MTYRASAHRTLGNRPYFPGYIVFTIRKAFNRHLNVNGSMSSGVTVMSGRSNEWRVLVEKQSLLIQSLPNEETMRVVPLVRVASLLAFIEASDCVPRKTHSSGIAQRGCNNLAIYANGLQYASAFEGWFCHRVLEADGALLPLLAALRSLEAYKLVLFLLQTFDGGASVAALAQRYGLSTAHFRRLCRTIFGSGLKRKLRQWRAQNALHDVLSGNDSFTALAYQHGFSSSSHFAQEMKFHFGARPGCLR